ncbi:MAG: NADP-dependent malic enzyme [Gemmatimonadetes bacterium]|nr:NADP-dependent malic enzyme [Gemmatimonadota bacterium]
MTEKQTEALRYHESGRPGKIEVVPTKPTQNQRDLSLAYTPGVAEPCLAIEAHPEDAYRYTAKGNLVAVVSNGSAVLGLGNIGPLASKPVMEGKGVLFKSFADLDVFDLEINATTVDEIVHFCEMLEPTVGGINLEDIKSPEAFEVEERLKERLSIPVFHDDQHGTAIISGAAFLNALECVGKAIEDVHVVFIGAGAAAIASAGLYLRLGVRPEHLLMTDSKGVLHSGRTDLDKYKSRFATDSGKRTVEECFVGADVFVGLSVAGAVTAEMLRAMAPDPIIFALANPEPEIDPAEALRARPDAIIATGRSDFPNQVNNVLGFPFIFRGALDVRANAINEEMKMAATQALAALAKEDVPEVVLRAYGLESLRFGRDYLIPKPFDPRVLLWVAPAVAQAAIDSGAAKGPLDQDAYRAKLESRLGRARAVMRGLIDRAAASPQRVAMTDASDSRVLRAARILADEGSVIPLLIGPEADIQATASELEITLDGIEVVDPATAPERDAYGDRFWQRRRRKGITQEEARRRMYQAEYFAAMMVTERAADAVVMGQHLHYPDAIRPALQVTGRAAGALAGIYMMIHRDETYFFADCTVNIDPDADRLTDIAAATAGFVRQLGIEPRIAMLSFSNFGSVSHPSQAKVAEAVRRLHETMPDLEVDGEMQADTALVADILTKVYPFSRLQRTANVLIFPDLTAANISYKLMSRLGEARAIGPILVGLAQPIHVLQRGADVDDIVNMAVIAAVDAQERVRARRSAARPSL